MTLRLKLPDLPATVIFICFFISCVFSAHAAKVLDFIPRESFVYLHLQDIDEVYAEIEMSEAWAKVQTLLHSTIPEAAQGVTMALAMLGTDLPGVAKTVGYRSGVALWPNETEPGQTQFGLVVHSGGNRGELQRLTSIVTGMMGMSAGTLTPDAGTYRKVNYSLLALPQQPITYGFVDDFLVAGIGEGSFEKLIDTFRKKAPSLKRSADYAKAAKKLGSGQLALFCNVQQLMSEHSQHNLEPFTAVVDALKFPFSVMLGELNLLAAGEFLKFHARFTANTIERAELQALFSETARAVAPNIYHSDVNGLSLFSFSQQELYALRDSILQKKKPAALKQVPQRPLAVMQLNLASVLESTNGAPPASMLTKTSKEIRPLLAWVTVKENEAVLEATLSEKETPLEVLAHLVPFIAWHLH